MQFHSKIVSMDQNAILSSLCYLHAGAKLDKMLLKSERNSDFNFHRLHLFWSIHWYNLWTASHTSEQNIEFDEYQTEKILVEN